MNYLIIAAHPDDELLGCGASIAKWSQHNHNVHILIMAEGETSRDTKRDINLKANEFLDKKNAPDGWGSWVFGEVTEGIDIVEKIGTVATANKAGHGDVPIETILIESVEILTE